MERPKWLHFGLFSCSENLLPLLKKFFHFFSKSVARKRATKGLWEPKGEGGVFYESLNLNSVNKGLTEFCRFAAKRK